MQLRKTLPLVLAALAVPTAAHAQHAITGARTVLDFNAYTGAGIANPPAAGQLDASEWTIDCPAANDHQGVSVGGVTAGGLYSFTVGANDQALGWQPTGTVFGGSSGTPAVPTPHPFTLTLVNNSGSAIADPTVRYEVWVRNDAPRANYVGFGWSTDNVTYTPVAALDFTSPDVADATPAWVVTQESVTLTGTTIAAGANLYLQWITHDSSGSGTRDEFALDDITVMTPGCGEGVFQATEACDDHNTTAADGCSATCTVETGFDCGVAEPSVCTSTCGDNVVASDEACDDGNTVTETACAYGTQTCGGCAADCSAALTLTGPYCGDGLVTDAEACDDGGTTDGDGCSATCTIEHGFDCGTAEPSVCASTCGDGVIASDEACDDTNTTAGDGCSDACAIENGWNCAGEPSTCDFPTTCGNGALDGTEQCDDSNRTDGDGCAADCTVELNWVCSGEPSDCQVDTDGDGVADDAPDNCPTVANRSQADDDGDGIGNACDDSNPQGTANGCCSTGREDNHGWLALGVLVVVGLRRRRRAA